jgi:hypothetical protein
LHQCAGRGRKRSAAANFGRRCALGFSDVDDTQAADDIVVAGAVSRSRHPVLVIREKARPRELEQTHAKLDGEAINRA